MRAATGTGQLIAGRYRLQDPIGRGAMGVVWRGRDELLHRDVAVKEVRLAAGAPGGAGFERTLREARAAARLSHPGVITVFDILEEDGRPWIVMELVPGRSLDRVIAEDGPLPPGPAARLGASLLGALAAAHAAGVLHRDVKPANVLVTAEGRAVLSDFGIAKIGADASLTQAGMIVGTPGFTAPERIRGEPAVPASDLWSLGATLFAAVEGRGPYERPGGMAAVCAAVVGEEPPRAPSAGPLGPVIEALLRRDAAERPDAATAAALIGDIAADDGPGGLDRSTVLPSAAVAGLAAAGGAGGSQESTVRLPPHRQRGPDAFLDPPDFAALAMPGSPDGPGSPGGAGGAGGAWAAAGGTREYALPVSLDPAAPDGGPYPAGAYPDGAYPGGEYQAGAYADGGYPADADQGDAHPVGTYQAGVHQAGVHEGGAYPAGAYPAGAHGGPAPGRRPARGGAWRLLTAGAALAAIVVAAFVGLGVYSHYVAAGNGGGQPAASPPAPGTDAGGAPASSPASAPRVRAAAAGAPPPGFTWHTVTGASLGSAAGFVIAAPDGWELSRQGQAVYLTPPSGGGRIEVSVAPFAAAPLAQAQEDQAAAIANGTFPGFLPGFITPAQFRGAAAAQWRFTWHAPGTLRATTVALLTRLPTAAGQQPYTLSVTGENLFFAGFRAVFDAALKTFRPLPG